jgi:hypothetical protein
MPSTSLRLGCGPGARVHPYDSLSSDIAFACAYNCSEVNVPSQLTAEEWACIFTDSCREILDYDACMVDATYTCD